MPDELNQQNIDSQETGGAYATEIVSVAPKQKKPVLLGLVSIVLIVIIGGGIVLYMRGGISIPGRPTPLPKVMENIKNGQSKCEGVADFEKCLRELTLDEAVSGKQAGACEKISSADLKDSCIDAVARELQKQDLCSGIASAPSREECVGSILFAKAKKDSDSSACAKITSKMWQDSCYVYVFESSGTTEVCNSQSENRKSECINIVSNRDAIAFGDISYCAKIEDAEARAVCEEEAGAVKINLDGDKDGLSDADEARYGTDKSNPDTDGDGFKDGDEVKAGYNPKGAGKLLK